MRFFTQVHNNLKSKLIERGVLAVVKGNEGVLQSQSRHRPRKFATCSLPQDMSHLP